MAASLINFSKAVYNTPYYGNLNVPSSFSFSISILPEDGNNANGGALSERARPVLAPMLDASGRILPQYVRIYKVNKSGQEISGTDLAISAELRTSSFSNGRPSAPVIFTLVLKPLQELDGITQYAFDYATVLPGEWLPKEQLTYISSSGSGGGGLGIKSLGNVITPSPLVNNSPGFSPLER